MQVSFRLVDDKNGVVRCHQNFDGAATASGAYAATPTAPPTPAYAATPTPAFKDGSVVPRPGTAAAAATATAAATAAVACSQQVVLCAVSFKFVVAFFIVIIALIWASQFYGGGTGDPSPSDGSADPDAPAAPGGGGPKSQPKPENPKPKPPPVPTPSPDDGGSKEPPKATAPACDEFDDDDHSESDADAQSDEPIERHHAWPKYLGGPEVPKGDLVPMPRSEHKGLHTDMRRFMRKQTDATGEYTMDYCTGYNGADIRARFTPEKLHDAVSRFYRGPGAKYAKAAAQFFRLHPTP